MKSVKISIDHYSLMVSIRDSVWNSVSDSIFNYVWKSISNSVNDYVWSWSSVRYYEIC